MSLKELKKLLKEKVIEEETIDRAIEDDEELKKIRERLRELEDKIDDLRVKIEKRINNIYRLITTDGELPKIDYSFLGKEHNIRDVVFQAIKKAGFRRSMLKDTQIIDLCDYIASKLKEEDKELAKLRKKLDKLTAERNKLWNKELKIEREIRKRLKKIPYTKWEIQTEINRKEEIKRNPKKFEKEMERRRFEESFDKIYEEFKKLIKK